MDKMVAEASPVLETFSDPARSTRRREPSFTDSSEAFLAVAVSIRIRCDLEECSFMLVTAAVPADDHFVSSYVFHIATVCMPFLENFKYQLLVVDIPDQPAIS